MIFLAPLGISGWRMNNILYLWSSLTSYQTAQDSTPPTFPVQQSNCTARLGRGNFFLNIQISMGLSPVVSVVKNLPAKAGDILRREFISWVRKIPGKGHGTPLQYSSLENPMDKGVRWATMYGITKNQTWLSMHTLLKYIFICSTKRDLRWLWEKINTESPYTIMIKNKTS